MLAKTLLALALCGAVEGRGGCGGGVEEPKVTTTSDNVTGLVWTLPWSWSCLR